jgi:hypothetical protein
MNKMKITKLLSGLAMMAVAVLMTACLSTEEPHNAGFQFVKPANVRTSVFANTTTDSLVMLSQGIWHISADTPDARWCTIDGMSGNGYTIYALGVHFDQNTTGQSRLAQFTIYDTNYPGDAHATWQYLQHATRGDGSLGTAALVKGIKSSDDWEVSISYDAKNRPVQLEVKAPDGNKDQYRMDYDEVLSRLTVSNGSFVMTGTMDNGYQAERLIGASDTIGYAAQYYSNGIQMSANYAFNYLASRLKRRQAYAYLIGGKSLEPDSLHTADSLIYYSQWKTGSNPNVLERYKLEYGTTDNRCQTVDVNQLLLGMDECEPLQLVSMFRYCRSSYIVKKATAKDGTIDVSTELNADRSVHLMVVKNNRRGTEVTYEFTY